MLVDFFKNLPWYIMYPGRVVLAVVGGYVSQNPQIFPPWAVFLGGAVAFWIVLAFIWHAINAWREHKQKAKLKLEPSHVIILGLAIALGGVIWQMRSLHPLTTVHERPQADDIAKGTEQKLKVASQQRDSALSENAALRRQIENLPTGANRTLPPPNPVEYRRLSTDQMHILVDEFSNALNELPVIYLSKAADVRGEANQYMMDFMEAFERAGIKHMEVPQKPKPRQTGVAISVVDLEKPPPGALKTQSILRDAGIVAPIAVLPPELISLPSGFTIFIGPNPL